MEKFDIVTIGSAVLDVLLKSKSFTPTSVDGDLMLCEIYGGKTNVEDALLCSGGAGTNTAVSFSRQGYHCGVIAEVGVDLASQVIVSDLEKERVSTHFLIEEKEERTGLSAVLVASDGSRSAMTYRGAAHMLTPKDIPFDLLQQVANIHLSSIGNPDLIRELFLFCTQHSIHLSWNPSKAEIEDVIFKSGKVFERACTVLCINDLEFEGVKDKLDVLQAMSEVLIVTKGKKGGDIWYKGNKTSFAAQTVAVVDETGAGDAFVSGFFGNYLQTKSLDSATQAGIANSTSVVQFLGAKAGLLRIK